MCEVTRFPINSLNYITVKGAKVNQVNGFPCPVSENNLMCNAGIENMNRILMSKGKDTLDDSKTVDMSFRETDGVVI